MTSTTLLPLHFASHLFTLVVATAAAFVLAGRQFGTRPTRLAGGLGFLTLAVYEALHGSALLGETSAVGAYVRTAGYLLIVASAMLSRGTSFAGVALVAPMQAMAPAAAALAAGFGLAWRSERDRVHLALAAGLVMMGAGESLLAVSETGTEGAVVLSHAARFLGWGLVAAGVMSASRKSIRFRFVASFAAVLLVVVLAVSSAITRVIGDNLRSGAAARVADQTRALDERFEPQALEAVQRAFTAADGFARGVQVSDLPDKELYRGLLEAINSLLADVDFMLAVGPNNEVLARRGVSAATAVELAGSDVTREALGGRPSASLDALNDIDLAVFGAAPLSAPSLPGAILVGYKVDTGRLELFAPGTPAFVVRGLVVSASTVDGVLPKTVVPEPLASRIETEAVQRGEAFGTTANLGGTDYFVSVRPMLRTDGRAVGALVGVEPSEILAATERGVNRVLFVVSLIAVAVAILLSLLFGRRFTRPVRQLTAAARRVQAGDLSTKAPVSGEDEVGDLAVAFNRMTESLSETTASLRDSVEQEARVRDQLETVLNSMGDGLIAVDGSGKVVTINPAAERIAGISGSRAVGRGLSEVLVGRTREGRALSTKENPSGFALLRRKGTEVPVAISSAPIRGGGDELLGRVYVIRDRSQEAEVERVKREFLATVSHELRTPLTPIVGYSELLTRRDFDATRVTEFARGILGSARRMERIVGMLLDYSAIEAGRMPVEPEAVQLKPLVAKVIDEWRPRAPSHEFVTRFATSPHALIDVPLFRRTMDELLDNAVKYSPDGGTITVSVRPNGRINGKAAVQVEVADQGIGIPAKQLPRVFQDFRQIDGSDTRAFGGLGLGLAFVKRIVQAHRGTITAESRPGKGTTFKIGLPAAESRPRRP
jgi:two-component system sensor histidine kinase VicK